MREYVESKGCGHLLPKLYGHWEKAEDIDYGKLPQSFVLKTTNGCGQVLIVPDKSELNIVETNKLLNQWMELKYGFTDAQIHYSRIEPCIIAEEYLSVNEKLNIIGNEYDIPMGEDFREDVSVMCNLSQKIKESGIEIGKKEMIVKMYSKGYTTAQIADVAGMEEKRIEEIIKNEELLSA